MKALISNVNSFKQLMLNEAGTLDIRMLRNASTLKKDEWKLLDRAIADVMRHDLIGISDLISRGLVFNVGSLGVLTVEWERHGDMTGAQIDLAGDTQTQEDTVEFDIDGVPIPIIHKDYRINLRRLLASRRLGSNIDTLQAAIAARKVKESMEDMLFNGVNIKSDNYRLYGYRTYPNRATTNFSVAWNATSGTPDPIGDSQKFVETMYLKGLYGPFVMYINPAYWSVLQEDYSEYKEGSILSRILNIAGIQDVKPSQYVPADQIIMVQMTPDFVDLIVAQDIMNLQWDQQAGMVEHYKVMAAMAPRFKVRESTVGAGGLVSGILHATKS